MSNKGVLFEYHQAVETLEMKYLVWNRLHENNFVFGFVFYLNHVIFCLLSLLCLKMAPGGLKLVAAINILQSKKCLR